MNELKLRSMRMNIILLGFAVAITLNLMSCELNADGNKKCSMNKNNDQFNSAIELIEKGNVQFNRENIEEGMNSLINYKEQYNNCAFYHYHLSVAYSYLVNISGFEKNISKMENEIKQGIAEAKSSINIDDNYSDSHRLLGSLYGRLIGIKSGLSRATYGAMYGGKSKTALDKALSIDPNNYKAHLAKGISKAKTPSLFGGDLDQAVELINKALELSPEFQDAQIWLGIVYRLKGKLTESEEILKEVLKTNPDNHWAKIELAKIDE